ncbi:MAG: hypothetical protein AMK69_04575 [Nitrospira bacterium SG8_3]|nr:MAG: hypothetical protein AMK69_04575 [Nitrospira bacterium SG8_3]
MNKFNEISRGDADGAQSLLGREIRVAKIDQEKARAVCNYLKEEFPACLVDYKRNSKKKSWADTWDFRVVCEGIFLTAVICQSVWITHDASSLYNYLKRISLANLLRKTPTKSVILKK